LNKLTDFLLAEIMTLSTNGACFLEVERMVEEYFGIDLSGYIKDDIWKTITTEEEWIKEGLDPESGGTLGTRVPSNDNRLWIGSYRPEQFPVTKSLIHEFIHALLNKTIGMPWLMYNSPDVEGWTHLFTEDIATKNNVTIGGVNKSLQLTATEPTLVGHQMNLILNTVGMTPQQFGQLLVSDLHKLAKIVFMKL
jgi:hypothetical protein